MKKIKRIEIDKYDATRYGWPWAVEVELDELSIDFKRLKGAYAGGPCGGSILIATEPGKAYAWGQRDHHAPRGQSNTTYFAIDKNGSEVKLKSQSDVRDWLIEQGK